MTDEDEAHQGGRPRPHVRRRNWMPADRTGGLIDDVFDRLRRERPNLVVQRLVCVHPGDDDNVFWLSDGCSDSSDDVQIDTTDEGSPPFIIEDDAGAQRRLEGTDADEIVRVIRLMLDDIDSRGRLDKGIT